MTENFAYGEINERSFSNPHPRTTKFTTVGHFIELHTIILSNKPYQNTNWFFAQFRVEFVC